MRKSGIGKIIRWGSVLWIGGCSTSPKASLAPAQNSPQFSSVLHREYLKLAHKQSDLYSKDIDTHHFSIKASQAMAEGGAQPEYPGDWNLPDSEISEMNDYRERLMVAFENGGSKVSPRLAAEAQVSFDCWIEEVEEGKSLGHKEKCKSAFINKIQALEAAMQVRAPVYVIWFNRNSAHLTPAAMHEIDLITQAAHYRPNHAIKIRGLTDGAGGRKFNLQLSYARAEAIKKAIMANGVEARRIATSVGKGEVEGTREIDPHNRRVEVQLLNSEKNQN